MSVTPKVEGTDATQDVEAAITHLHAGAATWPTLTLLQRADLLATLHRRVGAAADAWVAAACRAKQLDASSDLVGEEWMSGPYTVLLALETLERSLRRLAEGRSPLDDYTVHSAPGGRVAVRGLPRTWVERLILNRYHCDVWIEPGVPRAVVRDRAGLGQRRHREPAGIGVVLGAGNITSIAPLDVLYELFAHNRVSALKLNPVMNPLLEPFRQAFAPLIDAGFMALLTGGADVGTALVHHPDVVHVHLTGSGLTHDAIVWGTGEQAQRRRAENDPLLTIPVTSELGGVSPTIVVPGRWTAADLRFQARHVATQRLHNGGYNCIASQVVVVDATWPQKDAFLAELRAAFDAAPARPAYYPGSDSRVARAAALDGADQHGPDGGRLLVGCAAAATRDEILHVEAFSPVMGVLELGPDDAQAGETFLDTAVRVANDEFAGTLGANIVIDPRTRRRLGAAFEDAVARLRYGAIGINAWTAVAFLQPTARWGAFPGHTLDDVSSGIGVVHNALLLDDTERTVMRGPFRPLMRSLLSTEPTLSPTPPWFVTNPAGARTGRRLTRLAASRWSLKDLGGVLTSAVFWRSPIA